jgi:site-specific recombinase XerD
MGCTKYPVLDDGFYLRMMGACADDEERGMIATLDLTGMHVSSMCELGPENMIKQGDKFYIRWVRPKTNKTLQALVPNDRIQTIQHFLKMRRKSRQYYHTLVKKIGMKAGYQDVSPMTFRHNRCLRGLTVEGYSIYEIPQVMGCTLDVASRNYAKLREDQLAHESPAPRDRSRRKRGLSGLLRRP